MTQTIQVKIEEGSENRVRHTYNRNYAPNDSETAGGVIRPFTRVTFPTFEDYITDIKKTLLKMTERSVRKHNVRSDIELRVASVKDASSMNSAASYLTEESISGRKAVFSIYEMNLARNLYPLVFRSRRFPSSEDGKEKVQTTVDHEMRHHLDHDFIVGHYSILDEFSNLDDYTVRYLLKCRTEGFATYCGDLFVENEDREDLDERLKVHKSLFERFKRLAVEEYDIFEWTNPYVFMIDQVFNTEFIEGINFSPYKQGDDLMRVIACANVGIRPLSPEEYHSFLGEVGNHSLLSFYQEYFRASRELGLEPMFPEQETLELVESKLAHHND
jgi:hypothetical protein